MDNLSLTSFKWLPTDRDSSYNDVVRRMYDSLYEMNIECDVVDVNGLDPSKYEVIITPVLYSVKQETVDALKAFVQTGGTLISSFKSFVANEHLSVYTDQQPHGLTDVFGMFYNQFTEPGTAKVNGETIEYFAELLNPKDCEVLAKYEHKYWGEYGQRAYAIDGPCDYTLPPYNKYAKMAPKNPNKVARDMKEQLRSEERRVGKEC